MTGRLVTEDVDTVPPSAPRDEAALRSLADDDLAHALIRDTGCSYEAARERIHQARERVAARGDQ